MDKYSLEDIVNLYKIYNLDEKIFGCSFSTGSN